MWREYITSYDKVKKIYFVCFLFFMNQIIYILTNEAMPDYIKIWFTTTSVEQRLKQLDTTWVPLPFECYYAAQVDDAHSDERWLHSIFSDRRVPDSREFFKMNPELVVLALKRVQKKEILVNDWLTKEQSHEVWELKVKRSKFQFDRYNLKVGDRLIFTRNPEIAWEVYPGNKIKIGDEVRSLSDMAAKLLWYWPVQWTRFFKFEDEILDDMRRRIDWDEI